MLYFSYATNLNAADLRAWCAARSVAYPLGPKIANAWLPDHEPVFELRSAFRGGGVLNLRPKIGQATPGALFEAAEDGLRTLDEKMGAPEHYQRRGVTALLEDASAVEAVTFIAAGAPEERGHVPPSGEYRRAVAEGLAAHGLPGEQFEAVARGEAPPCLIPHLFTYGTLRRGGRRHNLVEPKVAELSPAMARGRIYDLGGYPGMVTDRRGGIVRGEVLRLRDVGSVLALLDRIEGFAGYGAEGSLFRRTLVRTVTREGLELTAWAYLWARPIQGELIASGDWTRR